MDVAQLIYIEDNHWHNIIQYALSAIITRMPIH
jgi:hypothetical protein